MARGVNLNVVIAGDTQGLDRALKNATRSLDKFSRDTESHSKRMSGSLAAVTSRTVGLAGGMAGVTAAVGATVSAAARFQKAMAEVHAVSGASAKQMDQLSKAAISLGTSTGLGATKAAQAIAELAKGGLSAQQIIQGGLKGALSLAAAGGLELADAATATANALNQFGLRGSQASHVADAFATAANATTADVSDFALALSQGAGAAHAAGLSFDQATLALEALAANGVKGSDAGTSLKSMLTQLARPTKDAQNEMRKLNLSFFDAHGRFKSLTDISQMLRDRFSGLTQQQRLHAAATIAGTDGMRGLLALFNTGPTQLAAFEKGLQKQGTAAEVARQKQAGLSGSMNRLKASMEAIGITIGNAVLPALASGATAVAKFLNGVRTGTGGASRAWSSAVASISGFLKRNRNDVNSVERATKNVATAIKAVIENVLIPAFKILLPAVKGVIEGVLTVLRGLVRFVSGVLTGDWREAWRGIKDIVSGQLHAAVAVVKGTAGLFLAAARGVGKAMIQGLVGGIKGTWDLIKGAADWLKDKVVGTIKGIFGIHSPSTVFEGLGHQMITGLVKGLKPSNIATMIKDAVGGLGSMVGSVLGLGGSGPDKSVAGAGTSGGARQWLMEALRITGQYTPSNYAALYKQMMSESGGDPKAINLWDSNAKAGHPSKGLLQTIDSTFQSYRLKSLPNDIYNPVANAVAAIRYMLARYGHIVGTGHGYASGTDGAAPGLAWVGERGPELVHFLGGETVYTHGESVRMAGGLPGYAKGTKKGHPGPGTRPRKGRPNPSTTRTRFGVPMRGPAKGVPYVPPDERSDEIDPATQALIDAQNAAAQAIVDAQNAAAAAAEELAQQQAALAAEVSDLRASVDKQTAFATSVQSTSNFQLTQNLADLLSGHIVGRGLAGRAFTPGTGVEVAYAPSVL